MTRSDFACMAGVLGALVLLTAAPAASQTVEPAPAAATTRPSATTTSVPAEIAQAPEFLALARIARQIRSVYVRGSATVESPQQAGTGDDTRKVEFEVWAVPPSAKIKVSTPAGEVRYSDGESVYTTVKGPDGDYQGRRRRITPGNLYHALPVAAAICDAAAGYANLAAAVKFAPAPGEQRFDGKIPNLKWFRLEPVGAPRHHLLTGVKALKVAINKDDGLVRVLLAQMEKEGKETLNIIVFEAVQAGEVKPADLLLPAEASTAKWRDFDTGQAIPVPSKVMAPGKP